MIDHLRAIAIFAAVAEEGSFSAASRRLKLTTSGISQHITKLEEQLGVTLLYRTTRALSLTTEGTHLLLHAQRMVAEAEEGLNKIADSSTEPAGHLKVSVPLMMASGPYEEAIWAFALNYPAVSLELLYFDHIVDLVSGGYDVALRLGYLQDSSLYARRIGSFSRQLVCAPSYLKTFGKIDSLATLKQCNFVSLDTLPNQIEFIHHNEKTTFTHKNGRILVNSFEALKSAVLAGLGVQRIPTDLIREELKRGELVVLLPEWSLADLGIYAVWPDNSRRSSLTHRFVEHLLAS